MADEITTTITEAQVVAVGGVVTIPLVVTPPTAGNFYMLVKQYTAELIFIPGSQAYLYQAGAGAFVNNTTLVTTRVRAAAGVAESITAEITVLNTDCFLYAYLMQRAATVIAGAFAVGTTYEITAIGTTDFTLVGATANTVGLEFTATGVGAGTGTATPPPDPDNDAEIDYVGVTLLSTAPSTGILAGIDLAEIVNLMITMMIVGMMMKMMMGMAITK